MLEMETLTNTKTQFYDCVECGQKDCVIVKDIYGFCKTPGCLNRDPIQFVYFPKWNKPKASRAGREILWIK